MTATGYESPLPMMDWHRLTRVEPQWALGIECEVNVLGELTRSPPAALALRTVDGRKCGHERGIMRQFARALECSAYFGHNWDALEDCLRDLEWFSRTAYAIVLANSDALLPRSDRGFQTFARILATAAEDWRSPSTDTVSVRPQPFHVIWHVTPGSGARVMDRCRAAGVRIEWLSQAER